jgi:aerobic carbon-monoxide dehydrogenase small subunit
MSSGPTFALEMEVNRRWMRLDVPFNELLLEVLRVRLGLTGTKRSCSIQECGACTVLLDGAPVSACSTLAWEARGRQVTTVEGLQSDGELHPLQRAFIDCSALQCGFCTPGLLMALEPFARDHPGAGEEEVRAAIAGHLCRCTGYEGIVAAVRQAARAAG